jgi:hypothetical protein
VWADTESLLGSLNAESLLGSLNDRDKFLVTGMSENSMSSIIERYKRKQGERMGLGEATGIEI